MTELRNLAGKTGQARAALDHAGRPVLSVPVVALVGDLVIHAVNSANPELVPVATLSRAPHEWAQKPVVLGHPKDALGHQISANSPAVLERHAFGTVSNPRVEKNKLCVDALIDEARAEKLGGAKFLQALRDGVPQEVSVGCFVQVVNRAGEQGGRKFQAVWENLQPDHLAFLVDSDALGTRGSRGACSISDGCGTARFAELRTATGMKSIHQLEAAFDKDAPMESRTLAQRLLGLLKFRGAATSFTEVQDALGDALRKVVPNFLCVDSVYTDDTVVYMVGSPLGGTPDDMTMFRRSFSAAKDGTVTLKDDAEEVEAVTTYEPKALGGPGSGWTAENGHTPGSSGGNADGGKGADSTNAFEAKTDPLRKKAKFGDEVVALVDGKEIHGQIARPGKTPGTLGIKQKDGSVVDVPKAELRMPKGGFKMRGEEAAQMTEEELKAAAGARNSATDLAKIQTMHDNAVALGATCAAGNVRVLAPKMQDCELCDGTGQVDSADCKACDGTGEVPLKVASDGTGGAPLKTAEDNAAAVAATDGEDAAHGGDKESGMNKDERAAAIKALTECPCSGFDATHLKMLEAASDEQITAFAERGAQIKAAQDAAKTVQDRVTALEADLKAAAAGDCPTCKGTGKMFGKDCEDCGGTGKIGGKKEPKAAEAKPMTTEEFLKVAPEEIRSLVARQKKADAAQRAALVSSLKAAQDAYSEADLQGMAIEDLARLAKVAHVDAPDFSGRGLPRTAETADVFSHPPDGYALAIAAQKQ